MKKSIAALVLFHWAELFTDSPNAKEIFEYKLSVRTKGELQLNWLLIPPYICIPTAVLIQLYFIQGMSSLRTTTTTLRLISHDSERTSEVYGSWCIPGKHLRHRDWCMEQIDRLKIYPLALDGEDIAHNGLNTKIRDYSDSLAQVLFHPKVRQMCMEIAIAFQSLSYPSNICTRHTLRIGTSSGFV
ncbi:hypothetical protein F5884DRAFT_878009 [Xylogone sp. PMI_703]|nr:hypothetical protein F5884DRAFT_878009 [Xylogone sp. PMI_703]